MTTRRQFIRSVGVTLVSLIATGCVPTGTPQSSDWDKLRQHWLDLDSLEGAEAMSWSWEQGQAEVERRESQHRAALDTLVAAGELDAAVADQIQLIFAEAAFHTWRSIAPITCYEPTELEYAHMRTRTELLEQADLLADMTLVNGIDEWTVTMFQTTIAKEIAFFDAAEALQQLEEATRLEAEQALVEQLDAGELTSSPEAIEAAGVLVNLLLGRSD